MTSDRPFDNIIVSRVILTTSRNRIRNVDMMIDLRWQIGEIGGNNIGAGNENLEDVLYAKVNQ